MPEQLDESHFEEILVAEYGPVAATFTITSVPAGGAPESIKEDWVGVPLPVRAVHLGESALARTTYYDHLTDSEVDNEAPVSIVGYDAVDALLAANKIEAATYWSGYIHALFTFRAHEGQLASIPSET